MTKLCAELKQGSGPRLQTLKGIGTNTIQYVAPAVQKISFYRKNGEPQLRFVETTARCKVVAPTVKTLQLLAPASLCTSTFTSHHYTHDPRCRMILRSGIMEGAARGRRPWFALTTQDPLAFRQDKARGMHLITNTTVGGFENTGSTIFSPLTPLSASLALHLSNIPSRQRSLHVTQSGLSSLLDGAAPLLRDCRRIRYVNSTAAATRILIGRCIHTGGRHNPPPIDVYSQNWL